MTSFVGAMAASVFPLHGAASNSSKRKRLPSIGLPCGPKRKRRGAATPQSRQLEDLSSETTRASAVKSGLAFAALADGPYVVVAECLGAEDLARADATCKLLRALNAQPNGPWWSIGESTYYGMELEFGGGFLPFDTEKRGTKPAGPSGLQNWKGRHKFFDLQIPTFSAPFRGNDITIVKNPDEVAYCRCRMRTDLLAKRPDRGIYLEVEILKNADNLSLAVVDFEGGGRSSVTFSPETGAVLRERKVREAPRAIEGTFIHLLPAAAQGRKFEGVMGLYLQNGHLAFFRRWSNPPAVVQPMVVDLDAAQPPPQVGGSVAPNGSTQHAATSATVGSDSQVAPTDGWETTGFCTDLTWAQGPRLSLCLAFRDEGQYNVRITKVGQHPPVVPKRSPVAYDEKKWELLYGDDDHPLAI